MRGAGTPAARIARLLEKVPGLEMMGVERAIKVTPVDAIATLPLKPTKSCSIPLETSNTSVVTAMPPSKQWLRLVTIARFGFPAPPDGITVRAEPCWAEPRLQSHPVADVSTARGFPRLAGLTQRLCTRTHYSYRKNELIQRLCTRTVRVVLRGFFGVFLCSNYFSSMYYKFTCTFA